MTYDEMDLLAANEHITSLENRIAALEAELVETKAQLEDTDEELRIWQGTNKALEAEVAEWITKAAEMEVEVGKQKARRGMERAEIERLREAFRHDHEPETFGSETCSRCGLNLRNPVHRTLNPETDDAD